MTPKYIGNFCVGLLTSGVILLIIACFLAIDDIDMFGFEEIINPEGRDKRMIIQNSISLIIPFSISILFLLFKNKSASIGSSIVLLFGIVIISKEVLYFLDKSNYYQPFEKEIWSKEYPLKMSRQLIKEEALLGMTMEDIVAKMGKGVNITRNGNVAIKYPVKDDINFSGLVLELKNNRVTDAYIECID